MYIRDLIRKFNVRRQYKRYVNSRYATEFKALTSQSIAIDCGANVGNVTALMATSGATVYAFEPDPSPYQVLQKRFRNFPNVHIYQKAVWNKKDRLRLYHHQQAQTDPVRWSVASSLVPEKSNVDRNAFDTVETIDIAQFVIDLNQDIALMKIDIEGVEYDIIEHLLNTGALSRIQHVLVETHEEQLPQLKERAATIKSRVSAEGFSNIDFNWK
ncbi:MAG: FkbM family methyltransferase [Candidatus Andersenbacteria bacterium]